MSDSQPGPQPDFERMAQASITIAEQCSALSEDFTRCRNLPALDNGAAIVEAIQTLSGRITGMQQQQQQQMQQMQQMQQQLQGMEERIGKRISATYTNSLSRLHNSQLIAPDQTLAPLLHPVNNTPVDGFPATPAAIANLSMASATEFLAVLGESTGGNIAAKRQRIRRTVGLKEVPA